MAMLWRHLLLHVSGFKPGPEVATGQQRSLVPSWVQGSLSGSLHGLCLLDSQAAGLTAGLVAALMAMSRAGQFQMSTLILVASALHAA